VGTRDLKFWAGAGFALGLAASVAGCGRAPTAPEVAPSTSRLLSRADLFGDPMRSSGQVSPRGDAVAFLAPRDGVMNLWVLSVGALDEARALTDERDSGVRQFMWAADNTTLVYAQEDGAGRAARLFAVDAGGGAPRPLTPENAQAEILGVRAADPGAVIVTLNTRDRDWPDVFRIDLATGERTQLLRNDGGFTRFILDRGGAVRLGVRRLPGGAGEVAARADDGAWRVVAAIPFEDALSSTPIAMDGDGRSFLMFDSAGRDRTALVRVDLETGSKTVVGESERADVIDVWLDPATNAPEAFATEYLRREWRALLPETQADLDFLDAQLANDFQVVSRSQDDARWIVVEEGPTAPPRSYLYDRLARDGRQLSLLFRHRPAIEGASLQPTTPIEIAARDGLTLVSYLTLPAGADENGDARPEQPTPLVITALPAPWGRESFGFNPLHQWLASRGYAVMSVNTRGSSGFGKAFLNAANGEWGRRVQDDLRDAAGWAIDNGIAEPSRIAIVGQGFGGYAAIAGMTFSPDRFRCGASLSGFGNLFSYVDGAPPSEREALYARVGDVRTREGRQALREQSPVFRAGEIRGPLFLAFGGVDPRAPRPDMDQLAQAARATRGAFTYLSFPDEGAVLHRPANRLSYFAILEHFLGDCLGGRVEPVGAAFEGANIEVYDGAVNVPGLTAFARRAPRPVQVQPIMAPGEAPETLLPAEGEAAQAQP